MKDDLIDLLKHTENKDSDPLSQILTDINFGGYLEPGKLSYHFPIYSLIRGLDRFSNFSDTNIV